LEEVIKMFKNLKYLSSNIYIQIAGLSALFLNPIADALGGNLIFWFLAALLIILFLYGLYDELKIQKKLKQEIIHMPIVIKVDDGPDPKYVMQNLVQKIEYIQNIDDYEDDMKKYFGINVDSFIFEYTGSIYDFDRLMSFARIIKYKLNQIEKQLNGRVKFHVAYYKRPSVGSLLGTIFRTEGIVVYQNNDFENRFFKVADINSRSYKERVDNFNKYDLVYHIKNKDNKEVLIVINSASHLVNIEAVSLQKYTNKIVITLKEKGTISYENDWREYASEIYTIINEVQTKFSHIVLAHAMPEAIAILLGMAIENYWNIDITQYSDMDYRYVYTMNKIKYYD